MTELRDAPAGDTSTVTAGTDLAIEVSGLRKRFGRTDVLERHRPRGAPQLDLRVPRPERRRQVDDDEDPGRSAAAHRRFGRRSVGHDVQHDSVSARASIGYLPQDVSYWRHLTVRGVLRFTARRYLSGQPPGPRRTGRRDDRTRRTDPPGRPQGRQAVGRRAATTRRGGGVGRPARRADPRRAVRRPRPRGPPRGARPARRASANKQRSSTRPTSSTTSSG